MPPRSSSIMLRGLVSSLTQTVLRTARSKLEQPVSGHSPVFLATQAIHPATRRFCCDCVAHGFLAGMLAHRRSILYTIPPWGISSANFRSRTAR